MLFVVNVGVDVGVDDNKNLRLLMSFTDHDWLDLLEICVVGILVLVLLQFWDYLIAAGLGKIG